MSLMLLHAVCPEDHVVRHRVETINEVAEKSKAVRKAVTQSHGAGSIDCRLAGSPASSTGVGPPVDRRHAERHGRGWDSHAHRTLALPGGRVLSLAEKR